MNNSPAFSLNKLDWKKILVGFEVALCGAVLTYIPMFLGFSYLIGGRDYTPLVVFGFSVLTNIARTFVADNSTQ